jgi:hypothetical protein
VKEYVFDFFGSWSLVCFSLCFHSPCFVGWLMDVPPRFPVLLALDGVNALDQPSGFIMPRTLAPISVSRLLFATALERFRSNGLVCPPLFADLLSCVP